MQKLQKFFTEKNDKIIEIGDILRSKSICDKPSFYIIDSFSVNDGLTIVKLRGIPSNCFVTYPSLYMKYRFINYGKINYKTFCTLYLNKLK